MGGPLWTWWVIIKFSSLKKLEKHKDKVWFIFTYYAQLFLAEYLRQQRSIQNTQILWNFLIPTCNAVQNWISLEMFHWIYVKTGNIFWSTKLNLISTLMDIK